MKPIEMSFTSMLSNLLAFIENKPVNNPRDKKRPRTTLLSTCFTLSGFAGAKRKRPRSLMVSVPLFVITFSELIDKSVMKRSYILTIHVEIFGTRAIVLGQPLIVAWSGSHGALPR